VRLGVLVRVNSGAPYELTTGLDDNFDGVLNDRPIGVRRNAHESPAFAQVDLRVAKLFPTINPFGEAEQGLIEYSVDLLNVFNRPNYGNVVGVMNSPLFGEPQGSGEPRMLQFAARYKF
jgi:hypothetical protein